MSINNCIYLFQSQTFSSYQIESYLQENQYQINTTQYPTWKARNWHNISIIYSARTSYIGTIKDPFSILYFKNFQCYPEFDLWLEVTWDALTACDFSQKKGRCFFADHSLNAEELTKALYKYYSSIFKYLYSMILWNFYHK